MSSAGRLSGVPASSQVRSDSWSSQSPMTLRRKRIRVVDAALVGEVRRPALLGDDRPVEFDADQRPRPAGDVGERRVAGRDADDRRRRVVRPDQRQQGLARRARLGPDLVAQRADDVAGRAERREQAGRQAERGDQLGVPLVGGGRRAAPSSTRS